MTAAPSPAPEATRAATAYRLLRTALVTLALALVAALWAYGGEYYELTPRARLHHPLHEVLKPSGTLGRRLGLIGTGLMALNLLYSARRRLRVLERAGPQRLWMDLHVFCGLLGPALLAYHAAFLAQNLVARLTAISTAVLVAAGVLGRYLYAQVPRGLSGAALEREELERERREVVEEVRRGLAEGTEARLRFERELAAPEQANAAGTTILAAAMRLRLRTIFGLRAEGRRLEEAGLPPAEALRLARIARRALLVSFRTAHLEALKTALAQWRSVHLKLAMVMIVCALVHIGVVSALGYGIW